MEETPTAPPPTITALKLHFLHTQILALSQPLEPSESFDETNQEAQPRLSDRVIDEVVGTVNNTIRRHNKLVYGPQATRHVAEQIDALYWSTGQTDLGAESNLDDVPDQGTDFCVEEHIKKLPETWEGSDAEGQADMANMYQHLQHRLVQLNRRRAAAKSRIDRYKALKQMMEPFNDTGIVQSSLVTKNGDLEAELERMKMLMARVSGRIENLPGADLSQQQELIDVDKDESIERLQAVLEMT